MFCQNCGTEMKEGMAFCPNCGEAIAVIQNSVEINSAEVKDEQSEDVKTVIFSDDAVDEVSEDIVVENPRMMEEEAEAEEKPPVGEVVSAGIISTEKIKYCPNCGTVNAENDIFCYSCGFSFAEEKAGKKKKEKNKEKKKSGKKFIGVLAALLVICLLAGGIFLAGKYLFGGSKKAPVFYMKGNETMSALSDKKIYLIGEDTYADKDDVPENYRVWLNIVVTEDYKYVFFPQEKTGTGFDLYRMPYGKKEAEAQKFAKNVVSYTVLANDTIIYLNDDNKLYLADTKDSEKIASDVQSYYISEDKKQVMWITGDDGDVYVQDTKLSKDKDKIASEVNHIEAFTDDFSQILMSEEDELILYTDFEDKTKVCSNENSYYTNVDGSDIEVYYFELAEEGLDLSTIIDDPDAEGDAAMKEPLIEDYQTTVTKDSYWGPRETVETDDQYYDDLDKYQKKLERDQFRQYIQNQYGLGEVSISYFTTKTMDDVEVYEGPYCDIRKSNGLLLLVELDASLMEPVSLEDLMEMEYDAVEAELDDMLRTGTLLKIYDGKSSITIDCDMDDYKIYVGDFRSYGDKAYIALVEKNGEDKTLFEISSNGSAEVLCEEYYNAYRCSDRGILYGAEEDNGEYELYLNDEEIESEVYSAGMTEDGTIFYMTDRNDDGSGTLWIYENDSKQISDDVITFIYQEDGRIAYLYDYSFKKYKGDLMIYANNKSKLIESDVRAICQYTVQ